MRKPINNEKIEGRIYQHNLVIKQVSNKDSKNYGKDFISGNLEVAVDEEGMNVIPVHFTYVTETTNSGAKNQTFINLKRIIDENKNWITVGKDKAFKVRINTAIALNDFYSNDDQLVSVKTNEGGFVTIINELCPDEERNTFNADMVITNVTRVAADPDRHIDQDYLNVRGAIFNFRDSLLPVDFIVRNPEGMKYFEELGATNAEPVYTKVWGRINCLTISTPIVEESAFGESSVRTVERKQKEWTITGTAKVPYEFGDESVITVEEFTKACQDREVYLADVKKRSEDYRNQRNTQPTTAAAATTSATTGGFSF